MDTKNVRPPKVSICIPVRNGGQFIGEAITSVLQQSFKDFEMVVVDNCSTDNTASLVREMALIDSRIRFFSNDHDIGLVGNLNECLGYARGSYIKFVLADDMLLPGCLNAMVSSFDEQPTAKLIAAGRLIIDEAGNPVAIQRYSAMRSTVHGENVIQRCIFGKNYIGEPTAVLFRRSDANRGFRSDLLQLTDLEMWFHLLEYGKLISLPEPLCAIRRHAGQMTMQSIKSDVLVEDNVRLFEEYGKKPYIRHTRLNDMTRRVRMTYRIWISRDYLEPSRRKQLLRLHAYPWVYYLVMPASGVLLGCIRSARQLFRAA